MHTEFEVKFLDINVAKLRTDLKRLGGKLVAPERTMRRQNFDLDSLQQKRAWARVRDPAGSVTGAYQAYYDFDTHELYHQPIVFTPLPNWLKPK